MKKILTITALLGAASLSFGQGIVSFANNNGTRISTNGTLTVAAPIGTWYFALFRAPSAQTTLGQSISTSLDPVLNGWTLVAIGTNTTAAGRLNGNTTTEGVNTTASAPSTDDYAVAGWSSNIGVTWNSVQAFFGSSGQMTQGSHDAGGRAGEGGWFAISGAVADNVIANPTAGSINGLFGTAAGLIPGFGLGFITPAPEPTTFALAGLGAAAMLIFRRRK